MGNAHRLLTRSIIVLGAACLASCAESDPVVMPARELPPGWKLVPSSDMPMSCKTPWWNQNPVTLTPAEIKRYQYALMPDLVGLRAVMYRKDDQLIGVVACTFVDRDKAAAFANLERTGGRDVFFVGLLRDDPKTVLVLDGEPQSRDFPLFVRHFAKRVKPVPTSQPRATQPDHYPD